MKVSVDTISKHEAWQKNAWQNIYLDISEGGFYMYIKVLHQRTNCDLIESTTNFPVTSGLVFSFLHSKWYFYSAGRFFFPLGFL